MTKKEAIKKMRGAARSIWFVEPAVKVAKVFGLKKSDLPILHYETGKYRAIVSKPGPGVSVSDLSAAIVRKLGGEGETTGPFYGAGRNAEYATLENCKRLEVIIGKEKK